MSDLTNLTANLATTKTAMYNRLVAQGDTTIQVNDSMVTYMDHFQNLVQKSLITLNVTENGTYTATSSLISGYGTITVNVPTGGIPTHKKYSLLDRIYDDSNAAIGTVSGFFTDSNNVEYAVIALDAIYRTNSVQWSSANGIVTNLPLYKKWTIWEAPETATINTQLILDWCNSNSYTSTACSHCRSKSFTIGGITYYGQLPNIIELVDIARHCTAINAADTSGGSITIANDKIYWSSSQYESSASWYINNFGAASGGGTKTYTYYVCPVLEIPNSI